MSHITFLVNVNLRNMLLNKIYFCPIFNIISNIFNFCVIAHDLNFFFIFPTNVSFSDWWLRTHTLEMRIYWHCVASWTSSLMQCSRYIYYVSARLTQETFRIHFPEIQLSLLLAHLRLNSCILLYLKYLSVSICIYLYLSVSICI